MCFVVCVFMCLFDWQVCHRHVLVYYYRDLGGDGGGGSVGGTYTRQRKATLQALLCLDDTSSNRGALSSKRRCCCCRAPRPFNSAAAARLFGGCEWRAGCVLLASPPPNPRGRGRGAAGGWDPPAAASATALGAVPTSSSTTVAINRTPAATMLLTAMSEVFLVVVWVAFSGLDGEWPSSRRNFVGWGWPWG